MESAMKQKRHGGWLYVLLGVGVCIALYAMVCAALYACDGTPPPEDTTQPIQTEEPTDVEETTAAPLPGDVTLSSLPGFFLDDVNRNGKLIIRPEDVTAAPGTMVDADCVPDSDRTALYGSTFHFRLTAENANDTFYFRYDTVDQVLAVVVPCNNLPLLLVFSAEVSGEEFAAMAREGGELTATLLYARNMASDHLMYLDSTYYMMNESDVPSDPEARYLLGKATAGSTEVYGTDSNHATERFEKILEDYYYPYK